MKNNSRLYEAVTICIGTIVAVAGNNIYPGISIVGVSGIISGIMLLPIYKRK